MAALTTTVSASDFRLQVSCAASLSNFFRHLLVVFGGVGGLEAAVEADPDLEASNPGELFQSYLNVCPEQGSRTIRTEEALLVALATLRAPVLAANR